jgi:hypothetical protein
MTKKKRGESYWKIRLLWGRCASFFGSSNARRLFFTPSRQCVEYWKRKINDKFHSSPKGSNKKKFSATEQFEIRRILSREVHSERVTSIGK